MFKILTLIFAWTLVMHGCNTVDPPPDLPEAVEILPNPGDTLEIEQGIDAVFTENGQAIELQWLEVSSQNLTIQAYEIFKSSDEGAPFELAKTLIVGESERDDYWRDDTVSFNIRYSYLVRAVDTRGNASDTSVYFASLENQQKYIKSYKLIHPVTDFDRPTPQSSPSTRTPLFRWGVSQSITTETTFYTVKLAPSADLENIIWIGTTPATAITPGEKESVLFSPFVGGDVVYSDLGSIYVDSLGLNPQIQYSWRIDSRGGEAASGAESRWISFVIVLTE